MAIDSKPSESGRVRRGLRTVAKCILHAYAFNLLFVILLFPLLLAFVVLVLVGSFLGLAIGFALLLVVFGAINSFLARRLWFPVRGGWLV